MEPSLSVVIAAPDDQRRVEEVLRAVLAHPATLEVVVVEGPASDAGTPRESPTEPDDARVRRLPVPADEDPAAERRRGLAAATAPYVALLDADPAAAERQGLDRVLRPLFEGRADVVFGAARYPGDRHAVPAGRVLAAELSSVATNVASHLRAGGGPRPTAILTATATATSPSTATVSPAGRRAGIMVVRREVVGTLLADQDDAGGLDAGQLERAETDARLAARLTAAGWRVQRVVTGPDGALVPTVVGAAARPLLRWRDATGALLELARRSRWAALLPGRRGRPAATPRALGVGSLVGPSDRPGPVPATTPAAGGSAVVTGTPFDAPKATDWLAALIEPWLGRRVVLLSGDGDLADRLARRPGAELPLTVLDRAEPALGELQRRFAGRDDLRVATGPADAFDRRSPADTVVLAGFLEHEADPAVLLGMLRAALAPGGRIVFLVPALAGLRRELTAATRPTRAVQAFDKPALRRLLAEAALRPEALRAVNAAITASPREGAPRRSSGRGGRSGDVSARRPAAEARRWAARSYDRVAVPVLRAVEDRVGFPVGQSLFCVATPATSPGRAQPRSGEGKVVVLP